MLCEICGDDECSIFCSVFETNFYVTKLYANFLVYLCVHLQYTAVYIYIEHIFQIHIYILSEAWSFPFMFVLLLNQTPFELILTASIQEAMNWQENLYSFYRLLWLRHLQCIVGFVDIRLRLPSRQVLLMKHSRCCGWGDWCYQSKTIDSTVKLTQSKREIN